MSDFSAIFQISPCMHWHVVAVSTGSRRFSQGEVYDDIQDCLLCLDCLEYVSEAEVRVSWSGKRFDDTTSLQFEEEPERAD